MLHNMILLFSRLFIIYLSHSYLVSTAINYARNLAGDIEQYRHIPYPQRVLNPTVICNLFWCKAQFILVCLAQKPFIWLFVLCFP